MILGKNIRYYREKKGLTQQALADVLFVTPQAVSRWETNQVEPNIETLRQLAEMFGVSLNQLILDDATGSEIEVAAVSQVDLQPVAEQVNSSTAAEEVIVVGKCQTCHKELVKGENFSVYYPRIGRRKRSQVPQLTCGSCSYKAKLRAKMVSIAENKKARTKGFVGGGIVGAIVLAIGIYFMIIGNNEDLFRTAVGAILLTYASFAFTFCIFARNNFILDWFSEIFTFGFVKMPGIIFSFSFGGIVFLIVAKILLVIIGLLIALGFAMIALVVCLVLSMFVFPFSLYWSINKPERYEKI